MFSETMGRPEGGVGRAAPVITVPPGGCQALGRTPAASSVASAGRLGGGGSFSACQRVWRWPCSGSPSRVVGASLDQPEPIPPITEDALQSLLDALEEHRDHACTLALHDAAYDALVRLRGGAADPEVAAVLAQSAGLEHPLRPRLLAMLGQRPEPQTRSLASILAGERGVPLRADPLEALELHLRQRRELVVLLEQRQDELVRNLERTSRMLDLSVGVAVLLFLLAGLGWAAAFDWLSVTGQPTVEQEQERPQDDRATPAGREHRSRP